MASLGLFNRYPLSPLALWKERFSTGLADAHSTLSLEMSDLAVMRMQIMMRTLRQRGAVLDYAISGRERLLTCNICFILYILLLNFAETLY